ncbi:MAG: Mor transcription activator family protein [Oscillospiraceae bacterium]
MNDGSITLDMLSENQREIAEIVGMENYLKLVKRFGGNTIYIQKYTDLLRPVRDSEIVSKFNGYNQEELAREYDLSVRTICKLVSPFMQARKNDPGLDQLSFDSPDLNHN